jgi:tetratricopeptide (TPR) repeat protein
MVMRISSGEPPGQGSEDDSPGDDRTRPVTARRRRSVWSDRRMMWLLIIGLPLVTLLVVAGAAAAGYQSGSGLRVDHAREQSARVAFDQFELALADFQEGRYELTRQRLEYILSLDPTYPGAEDLLNLTLQALQQPTATPIPTRSPDTPTPSATPIDRSSLADLLADAQAAIASADWTRALDNLLGLRSIDPAFEVELVNQLMKTALRNRGMERILKGQREQGIYDLTLAEKFGPLDSQAASWRRTAEYYGLANSYFGIDWPISTGYFADLCAAGVWDSCLKYARSAREYGDLLVEEEDICGASHYYNQSLTTWNYDPLKPTAAHAAEACMTATAPTPTVSPSATIETLTPTPSEMPGTATWTATATASATPPGSDTPTPTPTPTLSPTPTPTPTATPTLP